MVGTNLDVLLERQRLGFTLEQPFYIDPEIYRLDLERVLAQQWQYVDHVSRLPEPGDYLTYEIAGESIIVARGNDGELHAHFNVCRHRGSRICLESAGNLRRLVCPYHAWAYGLDGKLESARQMPSDFKHEDYGLHPCRIVVFEGLIFVSLAQEGGADFQVMTDNLLPFFAPHGLGKTKVVHREVYPTHANWKLAVENFRECYHCSPSHPEYTEVNAYVQANDRQIGGYAPVVTEWEQQARERGRPTGFHLFTYAPQPHTVWRMPIREGFLSLTKDGTPAGPLMGEFEEYDGAETGGSFGALSYFYVANDHATMFRFTPISPTFTEVALSWLVREDAEEGADYNVEHLKWMWDVTTIQDTRIINDNQRGVNSRRYQPGRYSLRETGSANFTTWYLSRLQGRDASDPAVKPAIW